MEDIELTLSLIRDLKYNLSMLALISRQNTLIHAFHICIHMHILYNIYYKYVVCLINIGDLQEFHENGVLTKK